MGIPSLLFAQQDHGVDGECLPRGNPRSNEAQAQHGKDDADERHRICLAYRLNTCRGRLYVVMDVLGCLKKRGRCSSVFDLYRFWTEKQPKTAKTGLR